MGLNCDVMCNEVAAEATAEEDGLRPILIVIRDSGSRLRDGLMS